MASIICNIFMLYWNNSFLFMNISMISPIMSKLLISLFMNCFIFTFLCCYVSTKTLTYTTISIGAFAKISNIKARIEIFERVKEN